MMNGKILRPVYIKPILFHSIFGIFDLKKKNRKEDCHRK